MDLLPLPTSYSLFSAYNGNLKRIPGISEKMLIDELKFLCGKGLIKKKQYPEVPPRVEYSLTPLGEKVLPIIDEIAKFGMENL